MRFVASHAYRAEQSFKTIFVWGGPLLLLFQFVVHVLAVVRFIQVVLIVSSCRALLPTEPNRAPTLTADQTQTVL